MFKGPRYAARTTLHVAAAAAAAPGKEPVLGDAKLILYADR